MGTIDGGCGTIAPTVGSNARVRLARRSRGVTGTLWKDVVAVVSLPGHVFVFGVCGVCETLQ